MTGLSPSLSRASALALLFGLAGALWIFAVLPIATLIDGYDGEIARARALLSRSQTTGAERPGLRAERDRLESRLAADSGFLEGDSLALVAAGLQDRIKRVVERHGGRLDSLQTLPLQSREGFGQVVIRVSLSVDTPALQRILHALESAQTVLLVDNLEISTSALGAGRAARDADALIVRLDVLGFLRGVLS